LAKAIGDLAGVVDLPDVEERVQLFQRGRHHQLRRGQPFGQRVTVRDQLQHGAREALLRVLDQQRRRRVVDADLLRVGLVREVDRGDLGLLERQLEEALHLVGVLRTLHPAVDQPGQRARIADDLLDLGVGGRQAQ
jgi:hypothetical protein